MMKINKLVLGLSTFAILGASVTGIEAHADVGLASGEYRKSETTDFAKTDNTTSSSTIIAKSTDPKTGIITETIRDSDGSTGIIKCKADGTILSMTEVPDTTEVATTGVNVTFVPIYNGVEDITKSVKIHDVPLVGANKIKFDEPVILGLLWDNKSGVSGLQRPVITANDATIYAGQNVKVTCNFEKNNAPSSINSLAKGNSKGWVQTDGYYYYIDNLGVVVSGWKEIEGKWYAFNPDMIKGFDLIFSQNAGCNTWYYFGEDGAMRTGWQSIAKQNSLASGQDGIDCASHWYYFGDDGSMKTGWQKIDGKWYYFKPYTGFEYYQQFHKDLTVYDGQMVTDTTIDGYYLNADGVCVS